jgi:hypothetical protein
MSIEPGKQGGYGTGRHPGGQITPVPTGTGVARSYYLFAQGYNNLSSACSHQPNFSSVAENNLPMYALADL